MGCSTRESKSYQIKCKAEIQTSGELYVEEGGRSKSYARPLPGKAVVVLLVGEIYNATSGRGPGSSFSSG